MPKPPRRPPAPRARKTDVASERVGSPAIVAKPADPRQAGLFDEPLPKWIKPCLPTLVDKPPIGPQWVHEIKWDGYRVSASVAGSNATIRTRNGHDWTKRFPAITRAVEALKVRSAVIDGEAVILDERGRSSFAELQADLSARVRKRSALRVRSALPRWRAAMEEASGGAPACPRLHHPKAIGDPAQRGSRRPWRRSLPHRVRARA